MLTITLALELQLAQIERDLADLEARRQQLLTERAKVVRQLIANDGWKGASATLGGVSRSRVYALAARDKPDQ